MLFGSVSRVCRGIRVVALLSLFVRLLIGLVLMACLLFGWLCLLSVIRRCVRLVSLWSRRVLRVGIMCRFRVLSLRLWL